MIALLLARPWVIAAVSAVVALGGVYLWGRLDGRSVGKVEQLQTTVDAIEDRKEIDNEVSDLGRDELCLALGGLPDDCAAVRRADKAASGQ